MVYLRLIKASTGHCDAVTANAAIVSYGEMSLHGFQTISIIKSSGEMHRFNVVQSTSVIKGYISVPESMRKPCRLHKEHVYRVEGLNYREVTEKSTSDASAIGIIGQDEVIYQIMRSAFESRKVSPKTRAELYQNFTRGVILYGPPGTGKTSMIKGICRTVGVVPNIVYGPELLNRYLGNSERLVRELFDKPLADQLAYGDESPLHVVVLDEMEALFPPRSLHSDGSNTRNSIVSQMLCMMDGFTQMNNLIIFGTTNHLDMIDPSLLRNGRFTLKIKIGLPNAQQRFEILQFYTNNLRRIARLALDVTQSALSEIATATVNNSGADLFGILACAGELAIERVPQNATIDTSKKYQMDESKMVVCLSDIYTACRTMEYRRRVHELDKQANNQQSN